MLRSDVIEARTNQPASFDTYAKASSSRGDSLWWAAARRLVRNKAAMAGATAILLLASIAFAADWIAPHSAREQLYLREGADVCNDYAPSADHLFGIDPFCRDTYSRVIYGARISLTVGIVTQVIALAIGLTVGGVAGLRGGWVDNLLMRLTDATYAFPDLLLIILFASVFRETAIGSVGGGVFAIVLAIGVVGWVTIARLVRGQILSLREREFVLAAQALGATPGQILRRHLLPNTLGPVIVAVTFGIPSAIFTEAALSYIGAGIRAPEASWGSSVHDGYDVILVSYWPIVIPAAAIAVTMLAFTYLGDGLRDALDPRTRNAHRVERAAADPGIIIELPEASRRAA